MKRIVFLLLVIMWVAVMPVVSVEASESAEDVVNAEVSQLEMPEKAEEFITENNIGISETEGILNLSPDAVFGTMLDEFVSALQSPLRMLASLFCVILISALLTSLGDTATIGNMSGIYGIVGALATVGIVSSQMISCIAVAGETLSLGGDFMLCYVPVFTGIVASSGGISSAVGYQMTVISVAEIFVQIASAYLMPVMTLCLCLGIVEAVNPTVSFSSAIEGIKKGVTFLIGLLSTVFTGLLTVRSIVATGADTLTVKVGKYMTSNLVPIVGGAVSDAYTTIRGSLGVLRSGAGAFGIIVIVMTVLPAIMTVASAQLCIFIGKITSDVFAVGYISKFLKSAGDILSVVMSLLISFTMLFVISTAIVMSVGLFMGGA